MIRWHGYEVTIGRLEEARRPCRVCGKPARYRFRITFVEEKSSFPLIDVCSKKCKILHLFKMGIA